ncbi:valine--tRNA ligase [Candidatus Saccharibacteria bacterium]|nr:valine--tRNA ligase [Candidatus Saccharibacteria bacterium]
MQLSKAYEPHEYESTIYDLWEQSGAFEPNPKGKGNYCIVLPPPNANAKLHVGHTLVMGIQDILIRYHRMKGERVLWAPGADHAGFETQVVYEKHLAKQGKSRFDFTREELYEQIKVFVGQNRQEFDKIFRTLGASVDWQRFTFTLDQNVVDTAYNTFKKMWDDGLIYRGERLVNYCTQHRTGFADIEVNYEDKTSPLYYLKYGPFELATTRPETKFGDTAVAVHPKDPRYTQYIGKVITVEGVNGPFEIRVVADEMVDINFGTGVVKITPAHDFNDWEVAQRHNLEAIRVINHDGTLNHRAGRFEGLTVLEARKAVAEALKEKNLLIKIDNNYKNRVGVCYKCGTPIEPMLLDQWFVKMDKLAKPAIKALKENKIKFYPDSKREELITYLKNVKDWNISRQIAWGIPIPAFQNVDDSDDWIFNTQVSQEIIEQNGKTYRRDNDVFDTWFSSGHWPFVTLGYPDGQDYKDFYPNSVMETGQDILFPWVSRMICIGLYITGEIPFKDVYLHGMVRAEDGRKMSKSLGNTIDPDKELELYGSDALRMGIIAGRSAGYSAAYAPGKVIAGRNFCNKLWNIARFCESALGDSYKNSKPLLKTDADNWIVWQAANAVNSVTNLLDNYRFSEAYDVIYHFVWDDVADWYIEANKAEQNKSVLAYILSICLRLAHPFAPFVTETIWQTLSWRDHDLLISSPWPTVIKADTKAVSNFADVQTIISEIRHITSVLQTTNTILYFTNNQFLRESSKMIIQFTGIIDVKEVASGKGLHLTTTKHSCWLDIGIDTATAYSAKLNTQKTQKEAAIKRLQQRLDNKAYTQNAPKEVIEQTKQQLADEQLLLAKLQKELTTFDELVLE